MHFHQCYPRIYSQLYVCLDEERSKLLCLAKAVVPTTRDCSMMVEKKEEDSPCSRKEVISISEHLYVLPLPDKVH